MDSRSPHHAVHDEKEALKYQVHTALAFPGSDHVRLDDLPGDMRVSSRCDGEREYIFLQHFGTNEVKVTLPPEADVILGDPQGVMKGYDTIIFRR